ncbi:MAG: acyl-CoA thioesterase [Prevotella sp.]|nr:acyl-CoA thioesterase [Prevotella sp.]MBR3479779.1 acyl-CoA thioesterase [Prevotella sp.]
MEENITNVGRSDPQPPRSAQWDACLSKNLGGSRNYIFTVRMAVRDYECDIEGIVNNAQYIHYCEHTRHLFLKECGLSFADMHRKGVDAVVARMSLQYKSPLRPDDEFLSCLNLTKEGIKYVFHQDIYRTSDNVLCFRGKIELVCLVNGRLGISPDYEEAFKRFV